MEMKRWPNLVWVISLISVLFLFASASVSWAAPAPIKIGAIYSITGAGSAVGKVQIDGIKLAIKQINDQGGLMIGGEKVKVEAVIRDDETKPDMAVRRYRDLIQENITFIAGGTFAHIGKALNEQGRGGEALIMCTTGIEEAIFQKKEKSPYFLSSLGAVEAVGRISADYVSKTYKPKNVFLFLPDYAYGRGAFDGASKTFSSKYPDVKFSVIWSPVGTLDYTSYIVKIAEAKPDVVMMGQWGNDAINALKQVHSMGLRKQTKLHFNSIVSAMAVGIPPEALEGVSMGMWWYHDLTGFKDEETVKATQKLNEVWQKEYGQPPDLMAMYAYVGLMETFRGIQLANSLEPAKVYNAILDNPEFRSVKGPAKWRIDGRPDYKYGFFILDGKGPKERKDPKWDFAKVVDAYVGEALCLPLKEMGW